MDKLEIYNQLKEEIIDLKIEPGALISENEISRRFEVSRTPVRDVFLRLCNDGLLEVLPQRGTKVSLIDMELVMATINMRTIVEIQILKDGIERRTPVQLQQLKMDLERQRQAIAQKRTPDEFYALDSEFHEHIFAIAGQRVMWQIINQMKVHYSRFRMLDVKANFSMNELLHEHEEIVEIVEKRQRERCGEVMRYHLEGGVRRLHDRIQGEFSRYFLLPPDETETQLPESGQRY